MPDEHALLDLATTYLEIQSKFWTQDVSVHVDGDKREAQLKEMVQSFRAGFLIQDEWDWEVPLQKSAHLGKLGLGYVRYSCDNSNPRSLAQQLRNILERANQDRVFIPWEFVLADAAVTGTIAARRGYQMVKTLLSGASEVLTSFYIDELGRANRDQLEALILGKLIATAQKRMIGVTDGFDSENPQSNFILSFLAMNHQQFIDQLRAKVYRGMRDAFAQGRNIRPAAIGYRLVPMIGADGQPVIGRKGVPFRTREIDPQWAPSIVKCFEFYVEKLWSRKQIAQLFNREQVGGKTTWDSSRIRQILRCETYAGFEHQNRIYRVIDPITGVGVTHTRPVEEWQRREVPHLAIIPSDLFERAQQRLEEQRQAYQANGNCTGQRAQLSPTLLVRPVCGYCRKPLWLGNSGKHPSLCCINGRDRKANCQLTSYKSVRIINNVILGFIQDRILTMFQLSELVRRANEFLVEEAERPQEDTNGLEREIQATRTKRDKLVRIMEDAGEEGLQSVLSRIRDLEKKLKSLEAERSAIQSRNQPVPPALKLADVKELLSDLPALLQEEVAVAAKLIHQLTGEIVITQKREEGKRGATWIASFTWDLVPILLELAQKRKSPSTTTWEYLTTRNWRLGKSASIPLEIVPRYEVLAPLVLKQHKAGHSLLTIASANNISWEFAKSVLNFAETGQRPHHRNPANRRPRKRVPEEGSTKPISLCHQLADRVRQMRDEEDLTYSAMCRILREEGISVSPGTLRRAYDLARPDVVAQAVKTGTRPRRGAYRLLPAKKIQQAHDLLKKGVPVMEIVKESGVSRSSVVREKIKLFGPNQSE